MSRTLWHGPLPVVPMLAFFTADTPYYAYKFNSPMTMLRDCQYLLNRLKVSNLRNS